MIVGYGVKEAMGSQKQVKQSTERTEEGSQVKIAWSKSRIRDLEFFRVRGEHEAGRGVEMI